jgi:hypothetical protein
MNDLNLKGCEFAADIVPYMYGELAPSECLVFESHLLECGDCTDEFAVVSGARYEVYDWKRSEFDLLPTPAFEIPYRSVEPAPVTWIEKIRIAFSTPWAAPGLAFATVVVLSVFGGAVYFSGSGDASIALNNTNKEPVVSQPAIDSARTQGEPALVEREEPVTVVEPKPQVVRATPRSNQPRRTVKRAETVRSVETRATVATDRRAPRLNEFNEDEDTSLRLAQLFDDIDTRD